MTHLRHSIETVLTITLACVVISLLVTLVEPVRYQAGFRLLIVQRNAYTRDAYTAAKSTEYLSNVFNEVIYSRSFFGDVLRAGFPLDGMFSANPENQKKQWDNMVSTRINRDTGVLTVTVQYSDRDKALQLANAIGYVLSTKGQEYHGQGDLVSMKTLDAPQVTDKPVTPNIVFNVGSALAIGILLGLIVVNVAPGKHFSVMRWF